MADQNTTIKSTALDFASIKNNLKTFLANKDDFADYNFEASGLSNILDVLAHNTHMNALIANFALNESYLPTAQLRSSVVSLAEGVGYIPDTNTSSQARIRITFSTTDQNRDSIVPLPAYTKFSTTVDDVSYVFQTIETYYATDDGSGFYEFKTASGSNQIPIYEGTKKVKTFLVGEYVDNPVYIIPDSTLDGDTVTVNVFDSSADNTSTVYRSIVNATTVNANSTIYIMKESPNGFYELSFGDGETFGLAPSAGGRIAVEYLSTVGKPANGASVFSPVSSFTFGTGGATISSTLNVTTIQSSVGGDERETIESIRKNAPFQYASQNRMVTSEDYSAIILRNFSTLIKDITSWGGEIDKNPEYGAVYTSILFEDDVTQQTIDQTKVSILNLVKQLAVISWDLRFTDPVTTYIELDTFFQFNPQLTDLTLNAIVASVNEEIQEYFNERTGKFKQSFRRSNVLAQIDDLSPAILSSRADVRMQQRFTPTAPGLIVVITELADAVVSLTTAQTNRIVNDVTSKKYEEAASYMIDQSLTTQNFTTVKDKLADTAVRLSQTLQFPAVLLSPNQTTHVITSNSFTFKNRQCVLQNQLGTTNIQVVNVAGGTVVVDSIGEYNPGTAIVKINFFNPSNISGGQTQIKLSAVPANPSAISPIRNDLLVYDFNESSTRGVETTASN